MPKAKEEKVSLEEAVDAYVALRESGGGNTRRMNRVYGLMKAARKDTSKLGPIEPEPGEARPELDEEQQEAADELVYRATRVDDLVHPGGRLQSAREAVDTIIKQAEEGTLVQDGARKIAEDAKAAAEKTGMKTAAEEAAEDPASKKGAAEKEKTAAANKETATPASSAAAGSTSTKKPGS